MAYTAYNESGYKRNTGQYHPAIAGVWDVTDSLQSQYHGCGEVMITVDDNLRLQGIRYLEEDEEPSADSAAGIHQLRASASCYQLVVQRGTPSAAIIAALLWRIFWYGEKSSIRR